MCKRLGWKWWVRGAKLNEDLENTSRLEEIMYIYKISNVINNKLYVGKTTKSLEERFLDHCASANLYKRGKYNHQTKLYKAMIKYGYDKFKIEKLEECFSLEELNQKERFWIEQLDSINCGYNIAKGGNGGDLFGGHHHSKESKEKISKIFKGIKQDNDFALRRCKKHKKKVLCLETREIFDSKKEAKLKYGSSIYDAIKYGRRCKGYHFIHLKQEINICDDFINSELQKIKLVSEERIKNAHKKTCEWFANCSQEKIDEIKLKRRNSLKETISKRTKEERELISQKMSSINKGKHLSEETKKKISKSSKNRHLGKHWYNNGIEQVLTYEQPEGFIKGMLTNESKNNK